MSGSEEHKYLGTKVISATKKLQTFHVTKTQFARVKLLSIDKDENKNSPPRHSAAN